MVNYYHLLSQLSTINLDFIVACYCSVQDNALYRTCRTYTRCIEGNYSLPGMMRGALMEELAFAQGRGPDPATRDDSMATSGVEDDPLEIPR
jgi:hypothetical protein